MTLHDQLRAVLDEEAAIALLKKAVHIESITGNESTFAAMLADEMRKAQFDEVDGACFAPQRLNVWGRRGGGGGGRRLLFVGHTDTVPVDGWHEYWREKSADDDARADPFAAVVRDGCLWGRGAADLKAGICAALTAAHTLNAAQIKLRGDFACAFVGDEEGGLPGCGTSAGIRRYTDDIVAGKIARPDFAVYVEPTRLAVCPAQMGFFIADIRVRGRTAYFGAPELGRDAVRAAHKILSALWVHSESLGAAGKHDLVGESFILVTGIRAGGYVAVPGECALSLIQKVRPGESMDAAVRGTREVIHAAVAGEPGITVDIDYSSARDHACGGTPAAIDSGLPAVRALSAAVTAAMPGRGGVEGAIYWSEIPFLIDKANCPAVYCGPGDIRCCHTSEERVPLDEYLAAAHAFAVFAAEFCGVV